MTHSTDPTYLLGETSAEHERLIRQAHVFDPFTERLLRDAGVDTVTVSWTSVPASGTWLYWQGGW
jgi:hypothetical protein